MTKIINELGGMIVKDKNCDECGKNKLLPTSLTGLFDQPPLIFQLLAAWFRIDKSRFKTTGLFRVTASKSEVHVLETHMSQADFSYLKEVHNGHVVANYWKRMLREMRTPLIPF